MPALRKSASIAVAALLALSGRALALPPADGAEPPPATRPAGAPTLDDVRAEDLDGRPLSLEPFRGHVVVLDFWASWCAPCRASFPFLGGLQRKYAADGLRVVGLTLEEDERRVLAFLDEVPAGFAVARDPSGAAGERFGVAAMPTTFLLDRNGRVAARFEGSAPEERSRLERAAAALLSGKPLPAGAGVRVASGLRETGRVKAWRRGFLADPLMSLDADPLSRILAEHVHASKEGAAGDGGAAGGGCGCN